MDRQSAAEIAAALGIAPATVKRWVEQRGWDGERAAIAAAELEIRANTVKARALALRRLLEAQSSAEASQAGATVAALEGLALEKLSLERREAERRATDAEPAPGARKRRTPSGAKAKGVQGGTAGGKALPDPRELSSGRDSEAEGAPPAGEIMPPADALGAEERIRLLEEAVNRQLAFVLAHPVDDLAKRIKEIKAALDVLASIKGRDARDSAIVVSFAEEEE